MADARNLRMPELNDVKIAGNLTRDPELLYTPSGIALCKFGVAVTRRYKDKNGERQEDTTFLNVQAWDKQGEYLGQHLKKGYPVIVEGNLVSDEWEDKDTGKKRSKIEVRARRVQQISWDNFAGGGDKQAATAGAGADSSDVPF